MNRLSYESGFPGMKTEAEVFGGKGWHAYLVCRDNIWKFSSRFYQEMR